MANTNCLEGFCCPECGSEGPFDIVVTTTVRMFDDGSEDAPGGGNLTWEDDSPVYCVDCAHDGTVASFTGRETGAAA